MTKEEWQSLLNSNTPAANKTILKCYPEVTDEKFRTCAENLVNQTKAKARLGDGHDENKIFPDDKEAFDLLKKLKPEAIKFPEALKDPRLQGNLLSLVKECRSSQPEPETERCDLIKGWRLTDFQSVAGAHNRLIIQIPGDGYYQLLLFINPECKYRAEQLVDMIVVRKPSPPENPNQDQIHFLQASSKIGVKPVHMGACYFCHTNGPRVVVPAPGLVEGEQDRQELNKQFSGIGVVAFPTLQVEHLGPAVGANQSCTACHNSDPMSARSRNKLTSTTGYASKMDRHEFSMPPYLASLPELTAFHKSMKKVADLNQEDQLTVRKFYGADRENISAPQENTFNLLKNRGLITAEEKQAALVGAQNVDLKMQELVKQFREDYLSDEALWRLGGSRTCTTDTGTEAPSQNMSAPHSAH